MRRSDVEWWGGVVGRGGEQLVERLWWKLPN